MIMLSKGASPACAQFSKTATPQGISEILCCMTSQRCRDAVLLGAPLPAEREQATLPNAQTEVLASCNLGEA